MTTWRDNLALLSGYLAEQVHLVGLTMTRLHPIRSSASYPLSLFMSLFIRNEPRLRFELLQTEDEVADALAQSTLALQRLKDDTVKGPLYEPIYLPKKGRRHQGEERIVFEVARELRVLHTEILESLKAHVTFRDCVFGFVRKRSTLDNAKQHHGANMLLNVDIKDFFGSIREAQVIKSFLSLGAGDPAARLLASICTFQGSLPQGAATSPILSNLACVEMDERLKELAARRNAKYTRYADDLSFSGDTIPEVEQVENVLAAYGFALNPNKTSLRKRGEAQYVTGLTIGSTWGVRLPNKLRRRLRLALYRAHRAALERAAALEQEPDDLFRASDSGLSGLLAYGFSVEPALILRLMNKFPPRSSK